MTSCLVESAEVSIGQKQTTQALALVVILGVKAVTSFLEQASEYILASARLVASQHCRRTLQTQVFRPAEGYRNTTCSGLEIRGIQVDLRSPMTKVDIFEEMTCCSKFEKGNKKPL